MTCQTPPLWFWRMPSLVLFTSNLSSRVIEFHIRGYCAAHNFQVVSSAETAFCLRNCCAVTRRKELSCRVPAKSSLVDLGLSTSEKRRNSRAHCVITQVPFFLRCDSFSGIRYCADDIPHPHTAAALSSFFSIFAHWLASRGVCPILLQKEDNEFY